MSVVEFRKCISECYHIDKLRSQKCVSVDEVTNIKAYFCKTSNLRNICTMGRGARKISIKKCKIYYFKIKTRVSQILDETIPVQVKKGASPSKDFAFFD